MITTFWAARTGREQILLIVMAMALTAYAMAMGVWQPLQAARSTMMQDIARDGRAGMALYTLASTGLASAPSTADTPLPTLITTTADSYQLTISRLLPSADTVEITLENASFDLVIGWIHALEQDHSLRVLALSITRRPEPGLVGTTLSVGR